MGSTSLRVAVLMGGRSAEREVSLHTGEQVCGALAVSGHDVVAVDTADEGFIDTLLTGGFDAAFICLHGRFGEDGTIQGLLELIDLPYVGSGVLASALAMDKVMSKQFFVASDIPTPAWVVVSRGDAYSVEAIADALGEKVVVKPVSEGSSVGMSIVHDRGELGPAIERAFEHDRTILVEEFVSGTEVTVGVLGNDELLALPTLEVVPEHEYYDYESKYVPGMSSHIIPARIPEPVRAECQRLALAAHRALNCRGMSRSDTIVTGDGTVYLLETNTIPGMTKTSLLPDAARAAGIEFPALCDRLVALALER